MGKINPGYFWTNYICGDIDPAAVDCAYGSILLAE